MKLQGTFVALNLLPINLDNTDIFLGVLLYHTIVVSFISAAGFMFINSLQFPTHKYCHTSQRIVYTNISLKETLNRDFFWVKSPIEVVEVMAIWLLLLARTRGMCTNITAK